MVLLRFDKQNKVWNEIPKEEKQEGDIYLDGHQKKVLDHYKRMQKKNNDVVLLITGVEGSGKSTLMGTVLEYISDGEFDPKTDLIGSDYLDGLEKIENTKKGGWIGFDEGNAFFLATETVKREHRDLHKIFSIFRQKNLFTVICLPGFLRMGTYFAIDRSQGLFRTYLKSEERGYFAFYGKKKKDKLYRLGKKNAYNENLVKPDFRGRFTKCFKMENQEYIDFKSVTLKEEIAKAKSKCVKPKTEVEIKREVIKNIIEMNAEKPNVHIADVIGITAARVGQLKREILA